MKYFIYCRKSTESEDRQILSLDSQQTEVERLARASDGAAVVEVYREAASAKAPGRPRFEEMLDRIERGEAEGIIAWHPDRLARNSMDGGRIIYLLDRGVLKDLRFATFTFENNPQGKFMLSIIFGYSKYYVDSLAENIKRGNRTKLAQGWRPSVAPLGYENDRETRTILPHPAHFPLIRRMYDLMLTGAYRPLQIARIARDDWGLRTPKRRRSGGKPLGLTTVYRILSNPFYAGLIHWRGEVYPGKHVPVVSLAEFDQVQRLRGRRGRERPKTKTFAFTGMIRCARCGLMVTAEDKVNRFGSRYTYYHCTKRGLGPRCPEPSVEARALEQQILAFLLTLTLPDGVHRALLLDLEEDRTREKENKTAQLASLEAARASVSQQLAALIDLRLREQITDEEFAAKRTQLREMELRLSPRETEGRSSDDAFEPLANAISVRYFAASWFTRGNPETKRLILSTVGSNLTLQGKILHIEPRKPFVPAPSKSSILHESRVVEDVRTAMREMTDEDCALIKRNLTILREQFESADRDLAA